MDFEKKYEEEVKVNKLDDEFISDLAEKMAKKRKAALAAAVSESTAGNVEIIKQDNRRIYISRLAAAASVAAAAGIIIGMTGMYRFGKIQNQDPDNIIVTDENDSLINAGAETSCIQLYGTSAVNTYNDKMPYAVTSSSEDVSSEALVKVSETTVLHSAVPGSASVTEAPVTENVKEIHSSADSYGYTAPVISVTAGSVPQTSAPPVTSGSTLKTSEPSAAVSGTMKTSVSSSVTVNSTVHTSVSPDVSTAVNSGTASSVTAFVTSVPEISVIPEETVTVTETVYDKGVIKGEPVRLSADDVHVSAGDETEITVKIDSGTNVMTSFTLFADFSVDAFEITGVSLGGHRFGNKNLGYRIVEGENTLSVLYSDDSLDSVEHDKDSFIKIKIRAKADAAPGEYSMTLHRSEPGYRSKANYINDEKMIVEYPFDFSGCKLRVTDKK